MKVLSFFVKYFVKFSSFHSFDDLVILHFSASFTLSNSISTLRRKSQSSRETHEDKQNEAIFITARIRS